MGRRGVAPNGVARGLRRRVESKDGVGWWVGEGAVDSLRYTGGEDPGPSNVSGGEDCG